MNSKTINMKKNILFALLLIGMQLSFADCATNGMQFFPLQKEISLNSNFIIQGYATSKRTVESFRNRKIFLESDKGELTELILIEILEGEKSLTQAIFKVSKELLPNTLYHLKYSNETELESKEMMQYNRERNIREKVYWKTTDKKLYEALDSNLKIMFEKTETEFFGCGPAANAIFRIENKGSSEIWYKTEVIELETNKKNIFYITEWNGKLNVGHNMCSGAFVFKQKGKYKVRFTPMNIDGKELATSNWTTFESPFQSNKKL